MALCCLVIGLGQAVSAKTLFSRIAAQGEMVDEAKSGFVKPCVGVSIDHDSERIQKAFLPCNSNAFYAIQYRTRFKKLDKPYRIAGNKRQVIQGDSFAVVRLARDVFQSFNLVVADCGFNQSGGTVPRSLEGTAKHVVLVGSNQMPFHIAFSARNKSENGSIINGGSDDPSAFRVSSGYDLIRHNASLTAIHQPLQNHNPDLNESDKNQKSCKPYDFPLNFKVFLVCLAFSFISLVIFGYGANMILRYNGSIRGLSSNRGRLGWFLLGIGSICLISDLSTIGLGSPFAFWRFRWLLGEDEHCDYQPLHNGTIVLQKYLDKFYCCSTVIDMANVLNPDKQIAVIGALAEGSSIRSIERITGVHRDTIMRLGVKVGQGCATLLDAKMRDLSCHHLQFDEIWGFIGKKQRNLLVDDDETQFGDVWTFCAIDAETKLVPSFRCGKRDAVTANAFVEDVASRMRTRVQVTTDALRLYVEAIERGFGADVDYGRVIKTYAHDDSIHPERRYSAPEIVTTEKEIVNGHPDMELASTSHVERLNGTTRLHMRRLTRLTYAFSKKLENFKAAAALHFAYYNLVKRHGTLRCTPAMAAGVEQSFWSVGET